MKNITAERDERPRCSECPRLAKWCIEEARETTDAYTLGTYRCERHSAAAERGYFHPTVTRLNG